MSAYFPKYVIEYCFFLVVLIWNGHSSNMMENQKIMFAIMVAVIASVVTGVTAASLTPTPAYAAQPQHCSKSAGDCFPSEVQCEKRSPGKSGAAQC